MNEYFIESSFHQLVNSPYYFLAIFALVTSMVLWIMMNFQHEKVRKSRKLHDRKNQWYYYFLSSLAIGIVVFLSGLLGIKIQRFMNSVPIFKDVHGYFRDFCNQYLEEDSISYLTGWHGVGLFFPFLFIPVVGPYLFGLFSLLPQTLIFIIFGYAILCGSFNLDYF